VGESPGVSPVDYLETGVLHCKDNVDRLPEFPANCIDLVYLDPPFFSNRNYEVVWGDEAEIRSFVDRWAGGMPKYIEWMEDRVIELHRVLKPTGSLYLHCDSSASHYLKVMLDSVFKGGDNFRNEIVWKRTPFSGSSKARAQQLPRSHDLILFYTKGEDWTWNAPTQPYSDEYFKRFKWDDGDGRGPYRKTLLKTFSDETFERLAADNRLIEPQRQGAKYSYKQYLSESSGRRQIDDVWIDINALNPVAKERLGWPTQKPTALLDRIIEASSNEGDIVLDPFCGCGTTIAAAEQLNRKWIGLDISPTAIEIVNRRILTQTSGATVPELRDMPETEDDLRKLQPYEFQNWVMRAVNGTGSPSRSGDMGVDGLSFMYHEPIQVKQSDKVGRPVVDAFEAALMRSGKEVGYIVAFSFARTSYTEAVDFKRRTGKKIVLATIAELLKGVESVTRPRADTGETQPAGSPKELMRLLVGRENVVIPLPPKSKPSSATLADSVEEKD
jgi:site-specific DNA-methyltransferase (adenine-specific)